MGVSARKNIGRKFGRKFRRITSYNVCYTKLLRIDKDTETYWATSDGVQRATLEFGFGQAVGFNRLMLQEYIALGQRVDGFTFEIEKDGKFVEIARGTTIGYKRLLRFEDVITQKARLTS